MKRKEEAEMSIAAEWFAKALDMREGETLFIPVTDQMEQTLLKNELLELRRNFRFVNAVEAGKLDITRSQKNLKLYVRIAKANMPLLTGIIKDPNGVVREISLTNDVDRERKISLMAKDGLSMDEVQEIVGRLSDEEKHRYFGA